MSDFSREQVPAFQRERFFPKASAIPDKASELWHLFPALEYSFGKDTKCEHAKPKLEYEHKRLEACSVLSFLEVC